MGDSECAIEHEEGAINVKFVISDNKMFAIINRHVNGRFFTRFVRS